MSYDFFLFKKKFIAKCECQPVRPLLSGMLSDLMARVHWPVRPKSSGTRLLCHWHPSPPALCNTYFNKLISNARQKPCIVGNDKGLNKGQKGFTAVHLDRDTSVWVGGTSLPVRATRPRLVLGKNFKGELWVKKEEKRNGRFMRTLPQHHRLSP